jgi:hypothetical protein
VSAKHGPVGRSDLKGFDRQAQELILWAQEQGATVRVSRRGHAIIMAPNGGTAAIARKSKAPNRAAKNGAADVKRLFRNQ